MASKKIRKPLSTKSPKNEGRSLDKEASEVEAEEEIGKEEFGRENP